MAENAIDGTDWPITSPEARSEILLELKVDLRRLEERRSQSAANTPDDAATAHDLASCVRAYARLGEVDAGVPMAKQLFSIVTGDKRFSQQHQAEAANYLGMLAYQCLNEDRLDEALSLESLANPWYEDHKEAYEDQYLSSVGRLAEIRAGRGEYQVALSLVDQVLVDPGSAARKRPMSGRSGQLAAQRRKYRRLLKKAPRTNM